MNAFKQITPTQWVVAIIVMVAVAAVAYFGATFLMERGSEERITGPSSASDSETQLIQVRRGDLINSVAVNGTLEYANREELSFGFAGVVGEVNVEEGESVSAGQVLAALDAESIAANQQNIQSALVALQDAEEVLDELLNPAAHKVAEAELALLEVEQSIAEERELLADLRTVDPVVVETAKVKVLEKEAAVRDAQDALSNLFALDETSVLEAQLAILLAEQDVETVLASLESEPTDTALQLSQANADIAASQLEINNIEEEIREARSDPDPDAIRDLELSLGHAKADLEIAVSELENLRLQLESKLGDASEELANAYEDYESVLSKWLGLTEFEQRPDAPEVLFSKLGIDLDLLFDPVMLNIRLTEDDDFRAFILTEDDPETPWNESVIESWVAFYPGELLVECDHLEQTTTRLCVRREIDDAWEPIPGLSESLSMMQLEAETDLSRSEETRTKAEEKIAEIEEDLIELLGEDTDSEVISDLVAKLELANDKLAQAEVELTRLTNELLPQSGDESISHRITLQELTVARDKVLDAREALADLTSEPDPAVVEKAKADIQLALVEHRQALDELAEIDAFDDVAIAVSEQELVVLAEQLANAQSDLFDLHNPDEATLALRRADVAVARENYVSASVNSAGSEIVAPFDGIVSVLNISQGQLVNADFGALELADPSVVQIVGTVDEIDVLYLQPGDSASVSLEALGEEPLVGRVSQIAAFGTSQQGVVTYPVTIQTEPPPGTGLPEGLSAVAEVVIREQRDVLLIPIQALIGNVNEPQVLVVGGSGDIEARNVEIGISDDFWTEVKDGLSEGETIQMSVVGSDTSQFSGFRVFGALGGGRPAGGGGGGR